MMFKQKRLHFRHSLLSFVKNHPYLFAFILGFVYFSIVISWMFTVRTSEIAPGMAGKLVGVSAALIMISTFASGFVIFTFLIRRLRLHVYGKGGLYLIPAAWVISEYARSVLFSIVSYGPTGKIGDYWSYGNVGYFLGLTPLTYLGRFGGVYFMSFILTLIVVAMVRVLRTKRRHELILVSAILCAASFSAWLPFRTANGKRLDVGTISYQTTSYPAVQSDEPAKLLDNSPTKDVDTVVLPEYSGFLQDDSSYNDESLARVLKSDGLIIHSQKDIQDSYGKNMLTFAVSNGNIINQQQKWFTIPSGEFIPYIYQILLAYVGQEQLLLNFNSQKSVIPGPIREYPYTYSDVAYGALVCSGVTSPDGYRIMTAHGAHILTNSASLGTLGVSSFHHLQAEIMARQYAIDNARPFIQSAKDAPAFAYDHNGKLLSKSTNGLSVVGLQSNKKRTPYSYVGNWIVLLSALTITGVLLHNLHLRRRENNISISKNRLHEKNKTL